MFRKLNSRPTIELKKKKRIRRLIITSKKSQKQVNKYFKKK